MEDVHFKFDLIQKIPFQVRQQFETKVFFRPINSIDGFLYSKAPQVTQNLLNQKAIQQNKLIQQEYEQMTMSRLYFDPENSTDQNMDQPEELKYDTNIQFSTQSQVFLSILINENEQFDEIEQIITDLNNKIQESQESQEKTENLIIIIINSDNLQNNKNNENAFFDGIYIIYYQSVMEKQVKKINFQFICTQIIFKYVAKIAKESYAQMQFYRDIKGAIEQEATRKKQNCIIDIEFDQKIYKERRKNHLEFQEFLNQSKPFYEKFGIEFQRARKEEGFEGNLGKDRILFQPTKNCLINIIDSPFFILTIEDVEIMCCERVMQGTLSFDLQIIYKDLERSPSRIEAIDYEELPKVEAWMNKADILYFIVTGNLIWKNILFSIQKDFALFVQEGGWSKIMKDVMDHAPIQFKDDQSSIYEPSTSKQPTSYSEFTDEEEYKLNPLLYQEKSIIDSVSAIGDSENFMSQDIVLPVIKKVKIQEIVEVVVD